MDLKHVDTFTRHLGKLIIPAQPGYRQDLEVCKFKDADKEELEGRTERLYARRQTAALREYPVFFNQNDLRALEHPEELEFNIRSKTAAKYTIPSPDQYLEGESEVWGLFNFNGDSLAQIEGFLQPYSEQVVPQLQTLVEADMKQIAHVDRVIQAYERGDKPGFEEIVNATGEGSCSISEPYLQFLAGGSPHEGLSSEVQYISRLSKVKIADDFFDGMVFAELYGKIEQGVKRDRSGYIGDKKNYKGWKVSIGDYDLLRDARDMARQYMNFIASILRQDPTIKQTIFQGRGGYYEDDHIDEKEQAYREAFERYADLEWQRKDEALEIAHKLKGLYERRIEYFENLSKQLTTSPQHD